MGRAKWKGPYFDYKNSNTKKKTLFRNSEIMPQFVGKTFTIHNGKTEIDLLITNEMIRHKLGEFVFTRAKFSFTKKKSIVKKKK